MVRWIWIAACWPTLVLADEPARNEFFETRIRPVLVTECFRCHGPDKANADLRVDSRERLLQGGESGPAIVLDRVGESRLLQALKGQGDLRSMPPDKPLAAEVIADFETWIRDGAAWPATESTRRAFQNARHWAFVPVEDKEPPSLETPWSDHPVDRFVEAAWRKRGLKPAPEADARTLIRRLSFDVTGLPPTVQEVHQFERDYVGDQPHKDAVFAREIDRLLASPHYGERWGRHWMDVVRYADTAGDNADYPIPEVIQYRDYIIDALNADMPYDQFVREQLAGDLLPDADSPANTARRIQATGFLALSRRYATGPYELWHLTLEDTIDTVGKAFLGLTLKCARCHDHKFDPVTTNDYYALYGIFDSTRFPWAGGEEFQSKNMPRFHFVPLVPRSEGVALMATFQASMKEMETQIAHLEQSLATKTAEDQAKVKTEIDALRRQYRMTLRRGYPAEVQAAYAVSEGTPHDVAVQVAGDPTKPGSVVPRGTIAFLASEPLKIPADASGRKQLAEWITRPDHPLTARVMVNRLWQHHFGRGIVTTSSNFGLSGALPTHPELLDYLARDLVKNGWSLKSLHRRILTSRTWRLSSQSDEPMATIDTGNEYYWRQNRRRLDAEAIRDSFLAVTKRLNPDRPGRHPFPPVQDWGWTQHNQFRESYDSPHRSVYLMTQRLQRHPFLALFDGPDTNTTTDVRTSATVSTQALYLLNSPDMAGFAGAFADRLLQDNTSDRERIATSYEICFGQSAAAAELERAEAAVAELRRQLADSSQAERLSWVSFARIMLVSNAFFFVD